jgi:hypothetical protein
LLLEECDMTTLQQTRVPGVQLPSYLRETGFPEYRPMYRRSPGREVTRRQRGDVSRTIDTLLRVTRDLLLAVWAVGILAFWTVVVAGFVL